MRPGWTRSREPPLSAGSASSAATSPSATFGRMTFCSTVSRISPLGTYFSARSAMLRASPTESRPTYAQHARALGAAAVGGVRIGDAPRARGGEAGARGAA